MGSSVLAIAGTIKWIDSGSFGSIVSLDCYPSDGTNALLVRNSEMNLKGCFYNSYSGGITRLDHKAQLVISGVVMGFASGELSGPTLPIKLYDNVSFNIRYYIPSPFATFKCIFQLYLVDQDGKAAVAASFPAMVE